MFSPSLGERHPKLSEVYQFWNFDPKGKLVIEFLSSLPKITPSLDETPIEDIQIPRHGPAENICADHAPVDRFMDENNNRLLDFSFPPLNSLYGVSERKGLPPDFVGNFCLNRVFTESWKDADLTHALTALDYLTNLEYTRRRTLREATQRMRINEDSWRSVLANNTEAIAWVHNMQKSEDEIDLCYSNIWIDLRVWTMSKELLSEPFYKPSIIAMLNTLFPPVIRDLPSPRILGNTLYKYRNSFYRYIVSIEINGGSELGDFIGRLDHPGSGHTWSDVRQALKDYIKLTDSMMKQASQVHGISYFRNLSEAPPSLPSTKVSRTESTCSNSASASSKSIKSSRDGLKRESIKTDRKPGTEDEGDLSSCNMIVASPSSSESKYVLPSRSRFSGKPLVQKISSQDEIDAFFQGSPQTPRYSKPSQPSSASAHSLEADHSSKRRRSTSFSRPLTPSVEEHRVHRRSISAHKRISYEFHNTLPGTPELPSPQGNERTSISENHASQVKVLSEASSPVENKRQSKAQADKKKRSGFNMFRRRKKLDSSLVSIQATSAPRNRCGTVDVSASHGKSGDITLRTPTKPFALEEQTLKKKTSFRFLKSHKSREDCRAVSDNNSDRTVNETRGLKLKPKRSLTNLFASKEPVAGTNICENSRDIISFTEEEFGLRHTVRKMRSYSSIRSASSTHSNEGAKKTATSASSSLTSEDRIITSADIDEPFPFGNFVQPQTPAMLFEDPEERQENESIRYALLEKARIERMAKWEQSEDFKRRLESSRQKRRVLREEMDKNVQASKIAGHKDKEESDEKNTKKGLIEIASQNTKRAIQGFEKLPKTPIKERVLKIFADSYSPTSPVIN